MINVSKMLVMGWGLCFGAQLLAGPMKINKSEVSFVAIGKPGFLKINGAGATLNGSLSQSNHTVTGEVKVPMNAFVTGLDLRDEHMKKKYLEVEKYPEAVLKNIKLDIGDKGSASDVPFQAVLLLHGVEKPVAGKANVSKSGNVHSIEAQFNLLLSDYKIEIPSYAGVKVADKVDVTAKFDAEEQP